MDTSAFVRIYLIVAAVAVGSALLEGVMLTYTGRRDYDWKAAMASLVIAAGRRIADSVPALLALPGATWLYEHRVFSWDMREPVSWLVLFFALEFAYYWFHRASHRVRWFWANHAVHHSPNQFNLSAAYRLGWLGKLTLTLVFFSPLAWLGFAPQIILLAFAINLLYQFWIHAEWIPKLGSLEGIINTPSAHRVHHGANVEYLDANYGGVLLIFDRLIGTMSQSATTSSRAAAGCSPSSATIRCGSHFSSGSIFFTTCVWPKAFAMSRAICSARPAGSRMVTA